MLSRDFKADDTSQVGLNKKRASILSTTCNFKHPSSKCFKKCLSSSKVSSLLTIRAWMPDIFQDEDGVPEARCNGDRREMNENKTNTKTSKTVKYRGYNSTKFIG